MPNVIPYGHMVQEYYAQKVRALAAARTRARAAIRTPEAAAHLVKIVQRKITGCFGPFPPRTPLAPVVTGTLLRERYKIEKVIYYSRPHFPVTANLYIPLKPAGKCPAVIGCCGHSTVGKAADAYQAFCQSLAKKGFVVLIYDPISQGERMQYVATTHPSAPTSLCAEHNMLGNLMQLTGDFFGAWRAWDGIRALDYLLTRPEVDTARIGVTGNSGGGTLASYLNALDERFTMAAPSCFVTTCLRNIENELPADSEQSPPGFLAQGLDMADFFIARAPRPTLLLGQINDFFDPRGLLETYTEVRRIYALLGAAANIECFVGPDAHGYHRKNREAMYTFFARHSGIETKGREERVRAESAASLRCTSEGQVLSAMKDCRRVFDFNMVEAETLQRSRKGLTPHALRSAARSVLGIGKECSTPAYRCLRPVLKNGELHPLHISRFAVETEPGIQSILFFLPPKGKEIRYRLSGGNSTTLYIPHLSVREDIHNHELDLPADGKAIFALDVRGTGESLPVTCFMEDFFAPYDSDFFYASAGSLLGAPYLGGKVFDVLRTVALLQESGYERVHLVGRGLGAITGAFAALLSDQVTRVTLKNALLSYHELVRHAACRWPFSHMLPGVLRRFDLPDVYAALASKQLRIVAPWDEQMRPWNQMAGRRHAAKLGLKRVTFSESRRRRRAHGQGRQRV